MYKRTLQLYEKLHDNDHPNVVTTLNNLGVLYVYQGKYEEAEPLYQRCLGIRKKKLGKNHPDVETTLHNLARLHEGYSKAESSWEPIWMGNLVTASDYANQSHSFI